VAKTSERKSERKSAHAGKPATSRPSEHDAVRTKVVRHVAKGGEVVDRPLFDAVMAAARRSGLLTTKTGRIAGRVSPALIAQAKRRTGIVSDTDLIAFALASVALEDDFAETFKRSRGKIDPGLKLGF
jgi:hypothetical protein